ncbi:putative sporulation protein YtaF [Aneurinibacillus soli]|uniref:Manganese efflux pump MntP n=1 Tax=Aneurinibacillus soli TaxID=1500254 RepID=A0A0U5AY98_9BACL|nr:sporulation membrane protein YtaF [Aneurinibacillus soli]PYE62082.1 putative sporulation protein YtaF [Aneurinibacillus soli]BAU28730.1 manganese efflux pump MntP [Aneurinibacillus soli]
MGIISLLAFACTVSLDGLSAGMTYGIRRIYVPLRSILIIVFCSGTAMFLSMQIGRELSFFISPGIAQAAGGLLIVLIGIWSIYQIYRQQMGTGKEEDEGTRNSCYVIQISDSHLEQKSVLRLNIKPFGLIIEILRQPAKADINHSGTITGTEAFLLGLALSLDAFGAGIGAALIGYTPWLTAFCIGLTNGILLLTGLRLGARYRDICWLNRANYLPGMLLILYGLIKIW